MNQKFKLEIEMNEADYQAIESIAGKRGSNFSSVISDLLTDALEKIDPRELETNKDYDYWLNENEYEVVFTDIDDVPADEFAAISDPFADKF
ncbi:MAG: hypothetical protein P9L94_20330 [Candidatus Hinthialibacter antarcticus]|nr:hypothetical protein [Candidatus Hinthialibacter antarcticus]